MSFRVEFSTITGNAPPSGGKRPIGHGTPAEVAGDLLSYREKAGLDGLLANFDDRIWACQSTAIRYERRWDGLCLVGTSFL